MHHVSRPSIVAGKRASRQPPSAVDLPTTKRGIIPVKQCDEPQCICFVCVNRSRCARLCSRNRVQTGQDRPDEEIKTMTKPTTRDLVRMAQQAGYQVVEAEQLRPN